MRNERCCRRPFLMRLRHKNFKKDDEMNEKPNHSTEYRLSKERKKKERRHKQVLRSYVLQQLYTFYTLDSTRLDSIHSFSILSLSLSRCFACLVLIRNEFMSTSSNSNEQTHAPLTHTKNERNKSHQPGQRRRQQIASILNCDVSRNIKQRQHALNANAAPKHQKQ